VPWNPNNLSKAFLGHDIKLVQKKWGMKDVNRFNDVSIAYCATACSSIIEIL
jgi:hypothetical protein